MKSSSIALLDRRPKPFDFRVIPGVVFRVHSATFLPACNVDSPVMDAGKEALETARKAWEEQKLRPALERLPERSDRFETGSGIP